MRNTTIALSVLMLLCVAAAPKPTCPPMNWKAKDGAPAWVQEALNKAQETRQKIVEVTPAQIEKKQALIAEIQANPSHPQRKYLKSYQTSLQASRDSLDAATKPYVIPVTSQRDGVKLSDWVEPIAPAGKTPTR